MRLVTRADFDGLVCAVQLLEVEPIDEISLTHPQEITEKRFPIRADDVVANLPYAPPCRLWFDNRELTVSNQKPPEGFAGRWELAPSAARVVFNHYGSKVARFSRLVDDADRIDEARLSLSDILEPKGHILIAYTLDPRTGFDISATYFGALTHWLRRMAAEDILKRPEVATRVERIRASDATFREALLKHSRVDDALVITDFRSVHPAPIGNRFLVFALFPDCKVSVRVHWNPDRTAIMAAAGLNPFHKPTSFNVGQNMALFGGGGHRGAGSAALPPDRADDLLAALVMRFKKKLKESGTGETARPA